MDGGGVMDAAAVAALKRDFQTFLQTDVSSYWLWTAAGIAICAAPTRDYVCTADITRAGFGQQIQRSINRDDASAEDKTPNIHQRAP